MHNREAAYIPRCPFRFVATGTPQFIEEFLSAAQHVRLVQVAGGRHGQPAMPDHEIFYTAALRVPLPAGLQDRLHQCQVPSVFRAIRASCRCSDGFCALHSSRSKAHWRQDRFPVWRASSPTNLPRRRVPSGSSIHLPGTPFTGPVMLCWRLLYSAIISSSRMASSSPVP